MLHGKLSKNPFIINPKHRRNLGFTIVEIIVVLIVISILALATVYAYGFLTKDAVNISIQNDLNNAYQTLKSFQALNGNYPTTISCTIPDSTTNKCIRASNGGTYWYTYNNTPGQKAFGLTETIGTVSYRTNSQSKPTACPVGFIIVPGSATYGTSDFCVMKYEPKMDDNGDGLGDSTYNSGFDTWPYDSYKISSSRKIVSSAQGYPVGGIKTADIPIASESVCSGCHLITEAEWLTIAQNVASVPSNWSGGAVGSGYVYIGHSDNVPSKALVASTDDTDGYYGTGNVAGDMTMTGGVYGDAQKRTLRLTNGETIWDLSGNNYERTDASIAGGQQPGYAGDASYVEREYTDASMNWYGLPAQALPANNGLPGSSTWNCLNGMGGVNSNHAEATEHYYWRGGNYSNSCINGIYGLELQPLTTFYGGAWGFRVTK